MVRKLGLGRRVVLQTTSQNDTNPTVIERQNSYITRQPQCIGINGAIIELIRVCDNRPIAPVNISCMVTSQTVEE